MEMIELHEGNITKVMVVDEWCLNCGYLVFHFHVDDVLYKYYCNIMLKKKEFLIKVQVVKELNTWAVFVSICFDVKVGVGYQSASVC